MPFKEVKPLFTHGDYLRVSGPNISFSIDKFREYGFTVGKRVRLFIDEENSLLGIQLDPRGLKLGQTSRGVLRFGTNMLTKYSIKNGCYLVNWSDKHKMLVAKVEFEGR